MKRNLEPYDNIVEVVGWTPLVRLRRIARGIRTPVYGKAENLNPGGSVKDRIGLSIIEGAERRGELKPGGVIVEATSGNTGIGLAIAAAIKGYRCIFTIPDKMSSEKIRLLRAFGAEVIVVPTAVPPDHPEYYIQKAKAIVAADAGRDLREPALQRRTTPRRTTETTGPEIWEQTKGKITHFVCSPGTGGTVTGVGPLPEGEEPGGAAWSRRPGGLDLHRVRAHAREGPGRAVQGRGHRRRQDPDLARLRRRRRVDHASRDADAFRTARRLTREEGIFIGGSGGLNVLDARSRSRAALDDPEALRRHDPVRHRRALPVEALRRHLDAREPDAGGRARDGRPAAASATRRRSRRSSRWRRPANVRQALNLLSTWGLSQLPVVDGDESVGSVTEGLMARVLEDAKLLDRPVSEVMAAPFPVVDADVPARPARVDALEGDPGGARPRGRAARRDRQPLRRAARGGRDRLSASGRAPPPPSSRRRARRDARRSSHGVNRRSRRRVRASAAASRQKPTPRPARKAAPGGGRLDERRPVDRHAEHVGLELHQEVVRATRRRRRAARAAARPTPRSSRRSTSRLW